jgi:hypothetical protein
LNQKTIEYADNLGWSALSDIKPMVNFFAMQHIMDRVFYELFAVALENYGTWIVGWKNHQQDVLNLF